ncbi:hypothetical protein MMC25_007571 [Agyrium rufum]|nr:hypothetical protein [Agyrium rufum]
MFVGGTLAIIPHGFGRHAILIDNVPLFAKVAIFVEVIYNPAIIAIKGSILLLYARLFPGREFRKLLWGSFAFVVIYSVIQAFLDIFQCVPVSAVWDPTVQNPRCIDLDSGLIVCSSINIATDVLILALPVPKLWALKISTEKKVQLIGIFLVGGFVCIVSIIRATQIKDVSLIDPSWDDVTGGNWSVIECCVGVVTACLPTLRPIFNLVFRGNAAAGTRAVASTKDVRSVDSSRFKISRGKAFWGGSRLDDSDSLEMTSDASPFNRPDSNHTLQDPEAGWKSQPYSATAGSNGPHSGPSPARVTSMPSNQIKVQTEVEQTTTSKEAALRR